MSYAQGIDFRSSSGFVTDPSGCDAETGTTANYPRTSAQGNTVGWEQAPSGTRNRSASVDARLAGIAFNSSSSTEIKYRLDVPNGTYTLTLALGDATTTQRTTCHVYDGATVLATIGPTATTGGQFIDASGVVRTSASDWVTNEVTISVTITTGILRVGILQGGSASGVIAHLKAVQAATLVTASDTGLTVTDAIQKTASHLVTDTGATISDAASRIWAVTASDVGATMSDAVASLRLRGITDTGTTVTDATGKAAIHSLADTGLSVTDSVVATRGSLSLADTGTTVTDSLASLRLRGTASTGVTVTDSVASLRVRAISDTGATITDSPVARRGINLTATGATISDSIGPRHISTFLFDTGVTVADSLGRIELADTGLTVSDLLDVARIVGRVLTDTGLAVTDSLAPPSTKRFVLNIDAGLSLGDAIDISYVLHHLADTGITASDTITRPHARSLTDTGLSSSDSIRGTSTRRLTDLGVAFTDVLVVSSGARHSVSLTDRGLAATDTLPISCSRLIVQTGLALTDGVLVTINGLPPDSCYYDFNRFLLDLNASSEYAAWCAAYPSPCNIWTTYASAILAGRTPTPPSTPLIGDLDGLGTALVDAGIIALDGIVACRAKPPPRTAPHAAFTWTLSGLFVSFRNTSTAGASGVIASASWDFGDGNTDSDPTDYWAVTHLYASPGTYVVRLVVVGSGTDGSDSVSHPVTVADIIPGGSGVHIDAVVV